MANSLNKNLRMGDVVVAKKESVKEEFHDDLRMVIRVETFGTSNITSGTSLGVSWIGDKTEDRWDGYLLDPDASVKAQEEIINDPQYGWLFKIIQNMQKERTRQDWIIKNLRQQIAHPRTRVVSVYANALSTNDMFEITVIRSNGVSRTYHISRKLNDWLYTNLLTTEITSAFFPNKKPGVVRLYP